MNRKEQLMKELCELIDGYLFLLGADDPLTDSQIERIAVIVDESL